MNANFRCRVVAAALAVAVIALGGCALGNGSTARPAAALAVPQSTETQTRDPESKKESTRAPVMPTPAEFRTPVQASGYAADPKAPTGALIIKPPSNVTPPDPPPADPKQSQ